MGFLLAQSSSTTQGRNIPIVDPSFVSTLKTPALAPNSIFCSCHKQLFSSWKGLPSYSRKIEPLSGLAFCRWAGFFTHPWQVTLQILRPTSVDLSEFLSANLVSSDPESHLMLDGCLVLTAPPKKQRRQIEDITNWTKAFTVFPLVLTSLFPHQWKNLTLYQLFILRIHRKFSGLVWLAYSKAFREHAATTGFFHWSLLNFELFNF